MREVEGERGEGDLYTGRRMGKGMEENVKGRYQGGEEGRGTGEDYKALRLIR